MKFIGIIPARYHSSRLEGKPLVDIVGKPMIQHVYERAKKAIDEVFIATDDYRIEEVAKGFGAKVVMTSKAHPNGSSRCLEAVDKLYPSNTDKSRLRIVNIQGDEPLLDPEQLQELKNCFTNQSTLVTLVIKVKSYSELISPSECFVVINDRDEAMYFSRAIIPHIFNIPQEKWLSEHTYYKHVGLYGYTYQALQTFSQMSISTLERTESLEQNRWLQAGHQIGVGYTDYKSIPVDTPEDLTYVRRLFTENNF